MRTMGETVPQHVAKARRDVEAGVHYERATIFQTLLESDLGAGEKTAKRLHADATAVLGAGTETTSWALAVATFHLLAAPARLARLRAALEPHVSADPRVPLPPGPELEASVPYLAAVVLEGLRLSYGVAARTAREPSPSQPQPLVYRGEFRKRPVELVLPPGYAIGMSAVLAHHDETLFPDSHAFRPERWLDERGERRRDLEKGLLAFSKGSRACLGKKCVIPPSPLTLFPFPLGPLDSHCLGCHPSHGHESERLLTLVSPTPTIVSPSPSSTWLSLLWHCACSHTCVCMRRPSETWPTTTTCSSRWWLRAARVYA